MSDDLKPLLTEFGCSKFLGVEDYTMEFESSMTYLAPELMTLSEPPWVDSKGKKKNGTPTTKETDVWAIGLACAEVRSFFLLLGTMLADRLKKIVGGQEVFHGKNPLRLPNFILNQGGRPQKADFPNCSPEADIIWPLLELCWSAAPNERPTMKGIVDFLTSW